MATPRLNRVSVSASDKEFKILCPKLQFRASRALFYLGLSRKSLEIYLISNAAMRRLNKNYRKKDKVTDVLSFEAPRPFVWPEMPYRPIGEIYLAPAYIKSEGADINFLLMHGILHLLGHDHARKSNAAKMRRKENFLMKRFHK